MQEARFKTIATPDRIPEVETTIMDFWDRTRAFERSVETRAGKERFVFYEGPPTANGKPGVHHVMARLCKDLVCRYKTMQGYQVIRKGGWDTHGLPVEIEVEKALGIKSKAEIEAYGIGKFNSKSRESVFKYEKEWVKFTKRIGYWLDMNDPYVTCTNHYIESVWWILKEFWKKDLLYEGHKIVPYCPRCWSRFSFSAPVRKMKPISIPSATSPPSRRRTDLGTLPPDGPKARDSAERRRQGHAFSPFSAPATPIFRRTNTMADAGATRFEMP